MTAIPEADVPPFTPPGPYNEFATCVSCGSTQLSTKWCNTAVVSNFLGPREVKRCFADNGYRAHIHRECARCGRVFYQRPLDVDEAAYAPEAIERRRDALTRAILTSRAEAAETRSRAAAEDDELDERRPRRRRWWQPA
jgi:hypothetical protein